MRGLKTNMRRLSRKMKVLTKLLVTVVAFCVLSVSAFALEPQKNDNRQQPQPDKKEKEIPKGQKPPPPPPRNDNRGGGDKKGKP